MWASREFDPFHDSDDDEDPPSEDKYTSTPVKANTTPANELLMPTMPDLDELTSRRSQRNRKAPDRYISLLLPHQCSALPLSYFIWFVSPPYSLLE